jgi:hypothetical protein
MLIQFFTVSFEKPHTIKDFPCDENAPLPTCLAFDNIYSKFVFCLDASIDVAQICATNGFSFEVAQNLEVPIEMYNANHLVGVNFSNPINYYLYEKPQPQVDLSWNTIFDPSLNPLPEN